MATGHHDDDQFGPSESRQPGPEGPPTVSHWQAGHYVVLDRHSNIMIALPRANSARPGRMPSRYLAARGRPARDPAPLTFPSSPTGRPVPQPRLDRP